MTYAWNSAMDRNRATVSFDFQKAFDLVDRGICIGSKALPLFYLFLFYYFATHSELQAE